MGKALCIFFIMVTLAAAAASGPSGEYRVVKTWKLGGDGGWDYLTADSEAHRLFIARATRVMVVDTATGKQIGEIPDTPEFMVLRLLRDSAADSPAMAAKTP